MVVSGEMWCTVVNCGGFIVTDGNTYATGEIERRGVSSCPKD